MFFLRDILSFSFVLFIQYVVISELNLFCLVLHLLQVDYGQSAVLQCDGSALKGEDGSVHWEVMGVDVAILQGEEPKVSERFEVSAAFL